MKIDRVEAFPLSCTLPRPVGDGKGLQAVRQVLLVRVTTDEGAVGWGEGGPAVLGALQVRRAAASTLLGADPNTIDPLYDRLRHAGLSGGVLGAVDMALWDLAGHIQGRSVAEMLGGVRWPRVPAYASLHNYSESADLTDEWTELIQSARERGFRSLKLKVGGRAPREDRRYIEAARRAAGPDMDLMADANQTYDLPLAIKVGRLLEELGYAWFEEPLPRHHVAGYAALCRELDIAIAGGEGATSPAAIQALCAAGAVEIAQPDVAGVGGLSPSRFIPTIAQLAGVMPTWHVWNAALIHIATLHVLANQPGWRVESMAPEAAPLETTTMPNPMREELLLDAPTLDADGCFAVPTGPGLGVTINPEALTRYALEA